MNKVCMVEVRINNVVYSQDYDGYDNQSYSSPIGLFASTKGVKNYINALMNIIDGYTGNASDKNWAAFVNKIDTEFPSDIFFNDEFRAFIEEFAERFIIGWASNQIIKVRTCDNTEDILSYYVDNGFNIGMVTFIIKEKEPVDLAK